MSGLSSTRSRPKLRKRLGVCLITGMLGAGMHLASSTAMAQETDRIAETQVPPAVAATARANYLDSRDVAFRRFEDTGHYQVNFTTPSNVRMQVIVDRDGRVVRAPQLAPNQPEGAPAAAERERLAIEWSARVRQAPAVPAAPPPPAPAPGAPVPPVPGAQPPAPVAPVPAAVPGIPTTPGGPAAPAAAVPSTEVRSGDVPKTVLESLERFTKGGRDINYYRQSAEETTRYQAVYTAADGTRREVTVADNGSLMSGPLVLADQVDDRSLQADRPGTRTLGTAIRVDPTDIPARAMDTIGKYVQRGADVRYRRDTYADGSIGYTAHWVQADNGRRYFITSAENGDLLQAPQLSMYQPAATPGGQASGTMVTWDDLPDNVKKTLQPLTRRDAKARYYKQIKDNKVFYGSVYHDNGHEMWVRVDEAGETVVNPVSAKTGRPINTSEPAQVSARVPADATARIPADMARDRINFADLPKAVQAKVLEQTRDAKDVVNMKHVKNGVAVYHSVWTDKGTRKELFMDEKGEAVPFSLDK